MSVQLPLFQLPPVTRGANWRDVFGDNIRALTPEQRRERWEQMKALATTDDEREALAIWEQGEVCLGRDDRPCRYYERGWCARQALPAAFNPVMRMYGMACMGVGYEAIK